MNFNLIAPPPPHKIFLSNFCLKYRSYVYFFYYNLICYLHLCLKYMLMSKKCLKNV